MSLTYLADRRTAGTPDPAEVTTVTFGDKTFRAGRRTAAHLQATIDALAIQHPGAHLHVIQSCYHSGYAPSAGTHDGDGVLDLDLYGVDWWSAQRFLREQGWAVWYRHTGSWSSVSAWHLHAVSIGCPGPVGVYVPGQVADYYAHAFGLAGEHNSGSDTSWFPPDIELTVFDYPGYLLAQEDSMPYTDWPQADKDALAADLVKALLDTAKVDDAAKVSVRQGINQARNNSAKAAKKP